jgi:hypothetical protein
VALNIESLIAYAPFSFFRRPRFSSEFAFVPSFDLGLSGIGGVLSICFASSSRRRAISVSVYSSLTAFLFGIGEEPTVRQKRPKGTIKTEHDLGNIKAEIPSAQLAAIGALALAFNEVEATLDRLLFAVTRLEAHLQLEVSTRIAGIDGKLEIIKAGAKKILDAEMWLFLAEAFGENHFKKLKIYRDCVIHARHLNPSVGTGVKVDSKAEVYDTLVRVDILDAAYSLLVVLRKEFSEITSLVLGTMALTASAADAPERAQIEVKIANCRAQALEHRTTRLALPPLPEYPSESELRQADAHANIDQTEVLMHWWYEPFSQPYRPPFAHWLYHQPATDVPLPLEEAEKKKP